MEAVLEESQGVLSPFFFPLGGFILGKRSLGEKLLESSCQMWGTEIIKSPDAGSIPERKSAEYGIKGSFPEHPAPDGDGSYFQFQSKQIGVQHAGEKPRLRSKDRITIPHDGIHLGKV